MLKNNIMGGPSIIFNRYQEVNKTLKRGNKLCKNIIGFDAIPHLWTCLGYDGSCSTLFRMLSSHLPPGIEPE